MQLVPVLEIRHAKCVHTEHKNSFVDHVVSEDPLETVERWAAKGIKRIHFVDVDAIESGEPCNVDLLSKIKQNYPDIQIQVIGGIKCVDSAFIWVDAGADYLVLSGRAIRQKNLLPDICVEFPNKVLVEIGSRQGVVAMGSGEPTFQFESLAKQLEEDGVIGLLVTEVTTEGHVNSMSLLSVNQLSQGVELPIFAYGGIEKMDDLKLLLENHAERLTGILIGKVVHQEAFCLSQAQQMLNEYQASVQEPVSMAI